MEPSVSLQKLECFLRLLSHDVRNDLNAIDLLGVYLQELSEQEEVRQEILQLRASVRFAAQRMVRISKALHCPEPELVDYPLADLMEDWKSSWQAGEEGRRDSFPDSIGVDWERVQDRVLVRVDGLLVFEALGELLENAGAFSPRGQRVRIRAGEGIPEKAMVQIEQSFRGDSLPEPLICPGVLFESGRRGHYGIGLFRARRILESFGADLRFSLDSKAGKLSTWVHFAIGEGTE